MKFKFINTLKMIDILVLFTLLVFVTISSAAIVPNLPKCKKSDPNFDKCLLDNMQVALDLLSSKGMPEVNLPKIDPLEVPEIILDTKGSSVSVLQNYTNIKLYGYGSTKMKKAHMDFDKKVLTFSHFTPVYTQESAYDLSGNVLFLPIHGKGTSVLRLKDSTGSHTIIFEERKSGTETFFYVKTHYINWTANGASFDFDNLFDGNKELSDNILKVLNENWKAIWDDVRSGLEKAYGEVYQSMSRRFFSAVPINQIFLE